MCAQLRSRNLFFLSSVISSLFVMGMKYQQEEQNRLLSETWLRRPAFRANKGIVCMTWNGPHRSSAVTKAAMSHVQGGADLQGFSRHPPSSKKKKKKEQDALRADGSCPRRTFFSEHRQDTLPWYRSRMVLVAVSTSSLPSLVCTSTRSALHRGGSPPPQEEGTGV